MRVRIIINFKAGIWFLCNAVKYNGLKYLSMHITGGLIRGFHCLILLTVLSDSLTAYTMYISNSHFFLLFPGPARPRFPFSQHNNLTFTCHAYKNLVLPHHTYTPMRPTLQWILLILKILLSLIKLTWKLA